MFLPLPIQIGPNTFLPEDATTPYNEMMDLSDISDIVDVMKTTIHEDIPGLEDIFGLSIWTMVCIKHIYSLNSLQVD